VYNHTAYYFNLHTHEWTQDPNKRIYAWAQSSIYDGGQGRLLIYDHTTWEMSVSFDKGQTWGVFYKADHNWAHPHSLWPDGDNIYYIAYTEVLVMHFPEIASNNTLPETRQTFHADEPDPEIIELFPVKAVFEKDEQVYDEPLVSAYQLSSAKGEGYSRFLIHVEQDTTLSEVYILHRGNGAASVEQIFEIGIPLKAGDYELWYYNTHLTGCYFLNVVLDSDTESKPLGTTSIFY
jgi:hypothetical protein